MKKTKLQVAVDIYNYDLKELVLHEIREVFARNKSRRQKIGTKEKMDWLMRINQEIALQSEQKEALLADQIVIDRLTRDEKKQKEAENKLKISKKIK